MVSKPTIGGSLKILGKIIERSPPQVRPTIPGPAKSVFDPWNISRTLQPGTRAIGDVVIYDKPPNDFNPPVLTQRPPGTQVGTNATVTLEEYLRGRGVGTPAQVAIPPPSLQPRNDMASFDLGNILTTLGGSYINARYGQPTPVAYTQPQAPYYGLAPTPVVEGTNPLIPDFLEGTFGACPPPGYRYNKSGCLVKKRRRRKRLATQSDIRDLAALKQVLGGGQDLKTWIATH